MAAKRNALEAEYEETKKKLDAELAGMRAENQSEIDEAWQDALQEREQLLADAKQEADYYREQARRAVDDGESATNQGPGATDGRIPRPRSGSGHS